jgi:hypothetical protein
MLRMKHSPSPESRVITARRMNLTRARFYFWYHGYPMPQAEEGQHSF